MLQYAGVHEADVTITENTVVEFLTDRLMQWLLTKQDEDITVTRV